tara:strand:+ start:1618 stop:1800 length:183 start_codon:yes stop_codon:yes gene_type:complete
MNKFVMILLAFILINGMSSLMAYLVPTIPKEKLIPIIMWANVVLFLALFLPTRVASFLTF